MDSSKGPCGSVTNIQASSGISNVFLGRVYGPLAPGSWEASFTWTPPMNPTRSVDFKYFLERPATGYKRTYVITLVTYVESLGCRFSADNPAKTDEKLP